MDRRAPPCWAGRSAAWAPGSGTPATPPTLPPLEGALRALDEPPDVFAYPEGADAAAEVLARERPTHLIAIERPGRCRSGDYLNMRGVSVAAVEPPARRDVPAGP